MKDYIHRLLEEFKQGRLGIGEVTSKLLSIPYEDLEWARIDHHRSLRKGISEAIYGENKTPNQIASIAKRMHDMGQAVLVTRVDEGKAGQVLELAPFLQYNPVARVLHTQYERTTEDSSQVIVPIFTAGTSDIPVAEEAAITLEVNGVSVERRYDCGVAGIHRLADQFQAIQEAPVIIAVAGMDGVLPGVIAGMASCPVIGVPTSVGYGAHFNGISPLLTMLNSCSQGLTVVNVDNGFGAACAALLMVKKVLAAGAKGRSSP